ncbi:unnamed protein product [Closterium sp. Naga37s-1]|nr:unnamed protein product [Closterium sp. Naga37s-1]
MARKLPTRNGTSNHDLLPTCARHARPPISLRRNGLRRLSAGQSDARLCCRREVGGRSWVGHVRSHQVAEISNQRERKS